MSAITGLGFIDAVSTRAESLPSFYLDGIVGRYTGSSGRD